VTANLEAADGRRFGFQFTIFRSALAPPGDDEGPVGEVAAGEGASGANPASPWSTRQMYLAHFTLTDVAAERFTESERFTRGAAGLAGAWAAGNTKALPPSAPGAAPPPLVRVWLDDWELASARTVARASEGGGSAAPADAPLEVGTDAPPGADPSWPMRLQATDSAVALDIRLEPLKRVVLQGDRGLSQKGPEPGNASYYYSYPRLAAEGVVRVGGEEIAVSGEAWLDREWSTSALGEGQEGWDWFSLQLSDGSELMVYQIRRTDGVASPESEGVWVAPDGATTRLSAEEYTLTPTDSWESPVDGARYPSGWRIAAPRLELDLDVEPVLRDQELNVTFRYWEGAVDVAGERGGAPLSGRGYVELTGYAGAPAAAGS
jgi:predicted secreted hydrolase